MYDIATKPDDLKLIKVSQYDALMYLHAIDQNANLKIGVDAFILIWSKLRFWNILSIFVSLPVIYSLAKITYNIFAGYRFKKLTHCQAASQEVSK